ncbi:MAG: hypothetical protein WCC35_20000, partial [Bradyrhizobium sp.]
MSMMKLDSVLVAMKASMPSSYPSPLRAGLSHVQEHIDEETVVPGGAFEFASQRGLCIGMSAS